MEGETKTCHCNITGSDVEEHSAAPTVITISKESVTCPSIMGLEARPNMSQCDRQKPCASCERRERPSTCRYEVAAFEYVDPFPIFVRLKMLRANLFCHSSSFPKAHLPRSLIPLQPADREPTVELMPLSLQSKPLSVRDLDRFGYSDLNEYNTLAIFKKLVRIEIGSSPSLRKKQDSETHLAPAILANYLHLLRLLPSRPYVDTLVVIFFDESLGNTA
jgi:hypothetical protein